MGNIKDVIFIRDLCAEKSLINRLKNIGEATK